MFKNSFLENKVQKVEKTVLCVFNVTPRPASTLPWESLILAYITTSPPSCLLALPPLHPQYQILENHHAVRQVSELKYMLWLWINTNLYKWQTV